jgi:hypothetical protein
MVPVEFNADVVGSLVATGVKPVGFVPRKNNLPCMHFSVLDVHGELDIYYLIPNRLTLLAASYSMVYCREKGMSKNKDIHSMKYKLKKLFIKHTCFCCCYCYRGSRFCFYL